MVRPVSLPAGPLSLIPLTAPPRGEWRVPGSKSITNRALILAALAEGESRLEGVLVSDDTRHMRRGLEALGIEIVDLDGTTLLVRGGRSRLHPPAGEIFVGNSGTTVRFLAALATLVPGAVTLVGDEHMSRRPIADLVDALGQLGVRVECPTGCPPLTVHGGRLPGGVVTMRGDRSSQYFSALLMAGVLADSRLDVRIDGPLVSRPYVAITERMVADFGGATAADDGGFVVTPLGALRPRTYVVEPDASAASYPCALAAASGGSLSIPGLGSDAMQGDVAFADVLARAGAVVTRDAHALRVDGGVLRGVDEDMHHISDTVMTLAAIAPVATGPTTIRNVANIRIKETDRLQATVDELARLGQHVDCGDDWLRIVPRPIVPATVRCYGDHRIAMSFAILGALRPGITIEDPACVAKTYPGFWDDLGRCYDAVRSPRSW
jgi:3-phosphoshikimate 1-carboxyvinyltransferase